MKRWQECEETAFTHVPGGNVKQDSYSRKVWQQGK